jgi:ABC-type polysaccharide/polyol phosphate transport system ATPase subunit
VTEPALVARDVGVKFMLQHMRSPTVHSRIVRFLRGNQSPEEFWALRNVSFEVPKGTVFGIIGANGSGKSTMLRVLGRILKPDEGEIELHGRVSSLISLGAGFHPSLSGHENIFYNGMLLGLSRAELERKLDEIIEFSELGNRIDTPVGTYSSGMKARLAFSIAVHVEPEIVVLDEVIGVGDAQFRQRSEEKMRELLYGGATVVMVQHNMSAIVSMCTETMWLEKGAIKMRGQPLEVVNSYLASRKLPPIEVNSVGSTTD